MLYSRHCDSDSSLWARFSPQPACKGPPNALTVSSPAPCPSYAVPAGAAVLGGKHLAEHIDERKVAYL